jgi:hypothetical protein
MTPTTKASLRAAYPLSPEGTHTEAKAGEIPASRRPNRLDWLVYRFFRWWWNPILRSKPNLVFGLQNELGKWLKETGWKHS